MLPKAYAELEDTKAALYERRRIISALPCAPAVDVEVRAVATVDGQIERRRPIAKFVS
jgi:hypothetical protein